MRTMKYNTALSSQLGQRWQGRQRQAQGRHRQRRRLRRRLRWRRVSDRTTLQPRRQGLESDTSRRDICSTTLYVPVQAQRLE